MKFYKAFQQQLEESRKLGFDYLIEYWQEEAIMEADFFDRIDERYFQDVAGDLQLLLSYYNHAETCEAHEMLQVNTEAVKAKVHKEKIEQAISITEKFIEMLEDNSIIIADGPKNKDLGYMHKLREELSEKSKYLLEMLPNKMTMIQKPARHSKKHIRKMIYKMCDDHNIPKSKEVDKFIVKLTPK